MTWVCLEASQKEEGDRYSRGKSAQECLGLLSGIEQATRNKGTTPLVVGSRSVVFLSTQPNYSSRSLAAYVDECNLVWTGREEIAKNHRAEGKKSVNS